MSLETRDIAPRERHRAAMHHTRWVLTGLAIPLVWTLLEGPGWIGLALTLAVCALAGGVYAHGWRHRRAGYTLEVEGATIRVLGREQVPTRASGRPILYGLVGAWARYVDDPAGVLDGLTVEYVEEVDLGEGDPREVDPRAWYLDHPDHRVQIEQDLMADADTLRWELGHPLQIACAREYDLPLPGEREGWETEWRDWRDERGLI